MAKISERIFCEDDGDLFIEKAWYECVGGLFNKMEMLYELVMCSNVL